MYNTMNNPSAHPSYSHYYLLSPSTLFFVFFFCTSYCFFAHLVVFLHISLSFAHLIVFCTIIVFCTSYCFALFYFIAHFILISPFLTICMPLCYVTYIICILIVLHCHWADLIRLHFTSSYALYNYYVTNKETLTLTLSKPYLGLDNCFQSNPMKQNENEALVWKHHKTLSLFSIFLARAL